LLAVEAGGDALGWYWYMLLGYIPRGYKSKYVKIFKAPINDVLQWGGGGKLDNLFQTTFSNLRAKITSTLFNNLFQTFP
jgi:hypothetical protein